MSFESQRTCIKLRFNSLEDTAAPDTRRSPLFQLGTGALELAISLYKKALLSPPILGSQLWFAGLGTEIKATDFTTRYIQKLD